MEFHPWNPLIDVLDQSISMDFRNPVIVDAAFTAWDLKRIAYFGPGVIIIGEYVGNM